MIDDFDEELFEEDIDDDTLESMNKQYIVDMVSDMEPVYDETDSDWLIKEQKKYHEELRGIKREKNGRLKKGSQLAKKYEHKESNIILRYAAGMKPSQIVETTGYGKSSVYDVIKKYKNN